MFVQVLKSKDLAPESLLPDHCQHQYFLIIIKVVNSIVKPLVGKESDECSYLAKNMGKSFVRGVYEKFSTNEKAAIGR